MRFISKTLSKKLLKRLPQRPLTNFDLTRYVKTLSIPHFRGVFMRDNLPNKIRKFESGIINLDDSRGPGTHWTGYVKKNSDIYYFDSYGNLRPPVEVINYFFSDGSQNNIKYNYGRFQNDNSFNCGHLVLEFLYNNV